MQALLSCYVTALQDQLVSWFSISLPDRALVLLTVGFQAAAAIMTKAFSYLQLSYPPSVSCIWGSSWKY